MYGRPPFFVAAVKQTGEKDRFQLVVQVREGYWARWDAEDVGSFEPVSRDSIIDNQWTSKDDWFPVHIDPCPECGHYQALCGICRVEARHFLDAEWLAGHLYLCDWCVEPFFQYLEDEPMARWDGAELGAYACCDACGCDTWG